MSAVVRGAVTGVVIGLGLSSVVVATDPFAPPSVITELIRRVPLSVEPNDPAAVEQLLDAWSRWRSLAVTTTATSTRTVNGNQVLTGLDVLAQRPPDEVHSVGGQVVAIVAGERVVCSDAVNGEQRCMSSGQFDRQALIEAELKGLDQAVAGPSPDYALRVAGDCFKLRRQRLLLAPPLRDRAQYCFNPAGVMTSAELSDDQANDRWQLVEVRPVNDSDLTIPE